MDKILQRIEDARYERGATSRKPWMSAELAKALGPRDEMAEGMDMQGQGFKPARDDAAEGMDMQQFEREGTILTPEELRMMEMSPEILQMLEEARLKDMERDQRMKRYNQIQGGGQ